jgi:hypothetical protein
VWQDGYQSRASCRNVMVDLQDAGGQLPSGVPRTVEYKIMPN